MAREDPDRRVIAVVLGDGTDGEALWLSVAVGAVEDEGWCDVAALHAAPDRLVRMLEARDAEEVLDAVARAAWGTWERPGRPRFGADEVPSERDLARWLPHLWQDDLRTVSVRLSQVGGQYWGSCGWSAATSPAPARPVLLVVPRRAKPQEDLAARAGVSPLEWPADDFVRVHSHWARAVHGGRQIRHPLVPVVASWQAGRPRPVEPFRPNQRASLPRLARCGGGELVQHFPVEGAPRAPEQVELPGFAPVIQSCPSWLLWLYDQAGGGSTESGRIAPWPMRLFIGALLHLPIAKRDGNWHTIDLPTPEVVGWLHPDGWQNMRRDWDQFPAALDVMHARLGYIPVEESGSVAIQIPSVIPRTPRHPRVQFTMRVPLAAARGDWLDWPQLCKYGSMSAVLYRAYLSACAFMGQAARAGHPVTAEIGAPVLDKRGRVRRAKGGALVRDWDQLIPNPSAKFVRELTEADLASMLGYNPSDRRRRHDARRAFERLDEDGVVDLRRAGRRFFVFGPSRRGSRRDTGTRWGVSCPDGSRVRH